MINTEWQNSFPLFFAISKAGGVFDHVWCWIQLSNINAEIHRPFKGLQLLIIVNLLFWKVFSI